jgi:DNA mismatch repair protein MutS2
MPFAVGDEVHVSSLGKGTVREVRGGGRYLVEIKGRSINVRESQLSPLERRSTRREPHATSRPTLPARADAPGSIDLHGMTTDEAGAALARFLSDAILAGHDEVRVIHGRSGGRLKAAVHARLRSMPAVRSFHLDPKNPGVTLVVF